jgi:hypothetical protein
MSRCALALAAALLLTGAATADIIIDYTEDAGGSNTDPLNGLSASATFGLDGTELTILLRNTSTGVPLGAQVADSLFVSLGFNLIDDITILSGDSALIGPGSVGVGLWDGLMEGANVGDQWLWTNDGGGDLMADYAQIISTSDGQGDGTTISFNGELNPNVGGPFGGIAASPPILDIPLNQPAVSDSILFTLTLSGALSEEQLMGIAENSLVEFGSDFQYLSVPTPGTLPAILLVLLGRRRRR